MLAQWLAREFPVAFRDKNQRLEERGPTGALTKERRAALLDVQVKHVCARCNQSWMSKIENDAKTLFLPMMLGTPTDLSLEQQKTVAAWAAKTALLFLYAWNTPRPPPLAERQWLFLRHEPPRNAYVWLAAYSGTSLLSVWSQLISLQTRSDPPHLGHAELTTIAINKLVLQIAIPRMPVGRGWGLVVTPKTAPRNRRFLLDIWPSTGSVVRWPPTPMGYAAIQRFSRRFGGPHLPP